MDVLDLTDVAELLGEPEAAIRVACARFPDHVPTVGEGRERRFPSIALDVLRLVTDSMAAGAPDETTIHLLETHFPSDVITMSISDLAAPIPLSSDLSQDIEIQPDTGDHTDIHGDSVALASLVRDVVETTMLPIVHALGDDLTRMRDDLDALRGEMGRSAQADDLALLRVETRGVASALAATPGLTAATATATGTLLAEIALLRQMSERVYSEITSLRTLLDHRNQIAEMMAELGGLRTEVQRLALNAQRPSEYLRPIAFAVGDGANGAQRADAEVQPNGHHHGEPPAASLPSDSVEATLGSSGDVIESTDIAPGGVITQFAGRTPRRMGRSLFADDV